MKNATFEGNNGLSEGQEVEFIITIDGNDGSQNNKCGNNATGLNDTVELRYKLKFEKVQ